MATAKSTAKPAAKAAPAPAAKTAAKPAAKAAPAAKKAAAPAPAVEAPAAEDETVFEAGNTVRFLGYPEETPEAERILTEGGDYEVAEVTETGSLVVRADNPEFDPKKKESADKNPRHIEVEVFANEVELVEAEEEAPAEAEAAPAEAAAPAAKAAGKKAPQKAPAKAAAKAPAAAAEEPEEPADEDDMPELEGEDANVLELVGSSDDLIGVAQELEQQVSNTEFQLGGVLYHIRKDKKHREIVGEDGKPVEAYNQPRGGFQAFLADYFNVDYRKAMHLIEIYVNFTLAKIENPAEKVASIGWTKASKIAKHLVAEGSNPEELIQLAETNTVTDLVEAIKEQVTVGGTPGQRATRITLKFRYLEEEAASVESTLTAAKEQLGLKDIGEALAHIVTEWGTQNLGNKPAAAAAPTQRAAAAGAKPAAKAVAKRAAPAVAAA